MTVGIKYCGGCNPRYDRIAAVEYLKEHLKDLEFEYVKEGNTYDYAVVVCGCHTLCASHDDIKVRIHKYVVQSFGEIEQIVKELIRR